MATPDAPGIAARVKVVRAGEGRTGGLAPGVGVIFKIDGDDTGGSLSIVEHPFEVGTITPPHVHTREDELSIVLDGEMGFRSEDQEVVLGPGGYLVKPRGQLHAMWNAGRTRARIIEVISPGGFEAYFRDLSELTAVTPPDVAAIGRLAASYGLLPAGPDWLPGVIARYGLTPPPRA